MHPQETLPNTAHAPNVSAHSDANPGAIKAISAIILGAFLSAGCDQGKFCDGTPTPPEQALKLDTNNANNKYVEILNSNLGLKEVRDQLANTSWSMDGKQISSYQALIKFMNSYNPDNHEQFLDYIEKFFSTLDIDAKEKAFFLSVAQSLWVDAQAKVLWKLKDYDPYEVSVLFYQPGFHGVHCPPSYPDLGVETQSEVYYEDRLIEEAYYRLFPLAQKLLGKTQEESITNAARFVKANFFHAYKANGEDWGWNEYADGRSDDQKKFGKNFAPANLDRYFDERISGCHEPALVLEGLLRAMNIPAFNLKVQGHGVTYIPSIKKFVHGDNLVLFNGLPAEEVLLSAEAFANAKNDPLLSKYQENKEKERPELAPVIDLYLQRTPSSKLYLLFDAPNYSQEAVNACVPILDEEFPSLTVTVSTEGHFQSNQIDIRTLEDFADPSKPIW